MGVHTTQFAIRDPKVGLFEPVIELAAETVDEFAAKTGRAVIKVGGVVGPTRQAVREAAFLRDCGYDIALLSLAALKTASVDELIEHCRAVAEAMPLMGFYLQPAVGGRLLPVEFWRRFVGIENVVAIKMAPFNRYQTLDVIQGVAESGRAGEVALYTGNDDNIVVDLLSPYRMRTGHGDVTLRIVGGLLGHWACWTRAAVQLLERCRRAACGDTVPQGMLALANEVTDCNGAFFDTKNGFAGCIAGIHEVLARQGLMAGRWCLDRSEDLSPARRKRSTACTPPTPTSTTTPSCGNTSRNG